jgi:hypothetical protein
MAWPFPLPNFLFQGWPFAGAFLGKCSCLISEREVALPVRFQVRRNLLPEKLLSSLDIRIN